MRFEPFTRRAASPGYLGTDTVPIPGAGTREDAAEASGGDSESWERDLVEQASGTRFVMMTCDASTHGQSADYSTSAYCSISRMHPRRRPPPGRCRLSTVVTTTRSLPSLCPLQIRAGTLPGLQGASMTYTQGGKIGGVALPPAGTPPVSLRLAPDALKGKYPAFDLGSSGALQDAEVHLRRLDDDQFLHLRVVALVR